MSDLGIVLNKAQHGNIELQDNDAFSYSNTRLYDFLAKTSQTQIASNVIDPLCTFDVEFKFHPDIFDKQQSIYGASSGSQDTFLFGLANRIFKQSIASSENNTSGQLILQLGYYVQSMTLPQMVMPEAGKVPTLFGEFPVNNLYIKPDNNTFSMSILNTKVSIHDFIFYPWMREVTTPAWSYESQPYTTATVTVKFDKHCNSRYVFCGCRPTQIASRQPTQEPEGAPTRDVTMLFDYMFITEAKSNETAYNLKSVLENAGDEFKWSYSLQNKMQI